MFYPENIPPTLRNLNQWVLWGKTDDGIDEDGKQKVGKVPINAKSLKNASVNKPESWSNFETAAKALEKYNGVTVPYWYKDSKTEKWQSKPAVISGLGFNFLHSGIVGIDIDHCDDEIGAYYEKDTKSRVYDIINAFDAAGIGVYIEVSQSGQGLHIFVFSAPVPAGGKENGVEIYGGNDGRFFAMTGHLLDNDHNTIYGDGSGITEDLYKRYLPNKYAAITAPKKAATTPEPLPNVTVYEAVEIAKATNRKFAALWAGDRTAYIQPSDPNGNTGSELAFCEYMRYYIGSDAQMIDTAYRSSGLMRPKWDRQTGATTYGALTIKKALDNDDGQRFDWNDWRERRHAQAVQDFENAAEVTDEEIKAADLPDEVKTGLRGFYDDEIGEELNINTHFPTILYREPYFYTKENARKSCDYNYQKFLITEHLLDNVYYDEFSRSFVCGSEHLNDDFFRDLYGDAVKNRTFSGSINGKNFIAACEYLVRKYHRVHLARQYFDGLVWDKRGRLDTVLSQLYGADDNALTREALKIWMCAAVKRVYSDNPVKFDFILMLKGGQGTYKTSFFEALGMHGTQGRYFCNALEKSYIGNARSFALNMVGKLICYDGDCKVLKDIKNSDIKNFITRSFDTFDNKYDKMQSTINRQFVIGADTNENQILTDITGSRRYIVISIGKGCDYFHSANWHKVVTSDGLTGEELVNQLWAEAVYFYKHNPSMRLDLSDAAKQIQNEVNGLYNDTGIEPFYDHVLYYACKMYADIGTVKKLDIAYYLSQCSSVFERFNGVEQLRIVTMCLDKAGFVNRTKRIDGKPRRVIVPVNDDGEIITDIEIPPEPEKYKTPEERQAESDFLNSI